MVGTSTIAEGVKKLSKYGEVKTCKLVHPNVATIVIGKGFSENASETFAFIADCQKLFPKHTTLETCITEENFAMIVLINTQL